MFNFYSDEIFFNHYLCSGGCFNISKQRESWNIHKTKKTFHVDMIFFACEAAALET